jgi:predicted Zn-dependent peptidase
MLLVACGDVAHEEAERLATRSFAGLAQGDEQPPTLVEEPDLDGVRTAHLPRDTHQTYMMVGVPTVSMAHEDRSPLKIVELVLGMGASARLYQRLREQAGLVYSVHTVTANYEDAGYFAVQTSCSPEKADLVREAILAEWQALRREGVSEEELAAAKSNYAGTLARRFETNLALAGIFGVEGLLHHVETLVEAIARIDAVQRDDVVRVARHYLDPEHYTTVSMGRETETG